MREISFMVLLCTLGSKTMNELWNFFESFIRLALKFMHDYDQYWGEWKREVSRATDSAWKQSLGMGFCWQFEKAQWMLNQARECTIIYCVPEWQSTTAVFRIVFNGEHESFSCARFCIAASTTRSTMVLVTLLKSLTLGCCWMQFQKMLKIKAQREEQNNG